MYGKVLKVSSNDLYGNVDDRKIVVFAAFNHLKYMNKYVIFTFQGEYNKNKLYYGSVHLKNDSLVIFSVPDSVKPYIDTFTNNYLNRVIDTKEYSILDISKCSKVELVSYNEKECDKLNELDQLSIVHEDIIEEGEVTKKKPAILYVLLIIMILLGLGATYIYFMVDSPTVELKKLECTKMGNNKKVGASYTNSISVMFDKEELVSSTVVNEVYEFESVPYFNFKDGEEHLKHFNNEYEFTYDDDEHSLTVTYSKDYQGKDIDYMKRTLNKEGYTCQEGVYDG